VVRASQAVGRKCVTVDHEEYRSRCLRLNPSVWKCTCDQPLSSSFNRCRSSSSSFLITTSCSNRVFSSIARLYLLSRSSNEDVATLSDVSVQYAPTVVWPLTAHSVQDHHSPSLDRASQPVRYLSRTVSYQSQAEDGRISSWTLEREQPNVPACSQPWRCATSAQRGILPVFIRSVDDDAVNGPSSRLAQSPTLRRDRAIRPVACPSEQVHVRVHPRVLSMIFETRLRWGR
jgi:hypothetical protein